MKINPNIAALAVAALAAAWMVNRVFGAGRDLADYVADGWARLDGQLQPDAELTDGARLSQAEWIRRGYLRIDANGRSHITPAGNAYIERRKAAMRADPDTVEIDQQQQELAP